MAKKVLTPPTYAVNNVQQLPDQVVDDAPNVKQTFDKTGADTKTYLTNDLIAELQSEAADAGSYAIGHNSTLIASLNVGDALEENRQALTDVVLGEIPDNTLTEAKMANEMKKIAGGVYPYNDGDANKTSIDTLNDRTDYGKTVGGTGDAITITTATGDWTFAVGESIKGIAIANNTGAMTCEVDSDGVKPIKKLDGSSYVECEADDFEDNKPFELIGQNDGGDFFLLAPRGGSNIKSIQRLNVTWGSIGSFKDYTISEVDESVTLVTVNGNNTQTSSASDIATSAELLNSTTVRLRRGAGVTNGVDPINITVTEYNNVKSKQTGIYTVPNAVNTEQDVAVSAVDVDKCILYASHRTGVSNTVWLDGHFRVKDSTTLGFRQEQTSYYWQLLEFK